MKAVCVPCRLWYPKTALPDLLGVPDERIDDNRLYRALDELLPHKEALEVHLKNRLGELFQLEYDLLLYDVTSTFFEARSQNLWVKSIRKSGVVSWECAGRAALSLSHSAQSRSQRRATASEAHCRRFGLEP